jgi:hypothetical protein
MPWVKTPTVAPAEMPHRANSSLNMSVREVLGSMLVIAMIQGRVGHVIGEVPSVG